MGDSRATRWVDCEGRFDPESLGARPVEGGREADGTPLFIAQAHYNNAIVPGKCSTHLKAAFVPYANSEKECKVCLYQLFLSLSADLVTSTTVSSAGLEPPIFPGGL